MSTDLRQKLAAEIDDCVRQSLHIPTPFDLADVALAVFAEWLRDRAMIEERDGQGDISLNRWAAGTLREAADSITTPKGEHGGAD